MQTLLSRLVKSSRSRAHRYRLLVTGWSLLSAACSALCAAPELLADCRFVSLLPPPPALSLLVSPSLSSPGSQPLTPPSIPHHHPLQSFSCLPPSCPLRLRLRLGRRGPLGCELGSFLAGCVFLLTVSAEFVPLMEGRLGSSVGRAGRQLCARRGPPESSLGWLRRWPGRIRKTRGSAPSGDWGRAGPRGCHRRRDEGRTFCRQ